jgi:uncharacterized protein (TIGR02217 family)
MTFYAAEIEACPAYGWQGGPSIEVLIKKLRSRREKRDKKTDWFQHSYTLPFQNIRDDDYLEYIKAAFMVLGGPTDSFLVKDYGDFLATAEPLGVSPAGSTPVQLSKTYSPWGFIGAPTHTRIITKPVTATVVLYQNGVPKAGTTDGLTGLFTPTTAWTPASIITADFEFRVPCRFDQFSLPSTIDNRSGDRYAVNGSVVLLEVFGE